MAGDQPISGLVNRGSTTLGAIQTRIRANADLCRQLADNSLSGPIGKGRRNDTQIEGPALVTLEFKHKDGVIMRLEYRGDFSDTPFYLKKATESVKSQNTLTAGFIYAFSSKPRSR